jgi:hypothetical protein
MTRRAFSAGKQRRGAIAVLAALLILVAFAIVALAVDTGYMLLVRTQLQCAVDSAAIAAASVLHESPDAAIEEAQRFARLNLVAGKPCELRRDQIQIGAWAGNRDFTEAQGNGMAVRISADITDESLFFGKALGRMVFNTDARSGSSVEAVAVARPRDIVFVVDVSGDLNDDSEFAAGRLGDKPTYRDYLQRLYADMDFGSFPGKSETIGTTLGVSKLSSLLDLATPLQDLTISEPYRILPTDDEPTQINKIYKWLIECQITSVMPNVVPNPLAPENFEYWRGYVDYLITNIVKSKNPVRNQSTILACRNSEKHARQLFKRIGHLSYMQFMLDAGTEAPTGGQYVPLSIKSPDCPWHQEDTEFGVINFPPRVEPESAVRHALVEVLGKLQRMNRNEMNSENRDRVAIVLFSRPSADSTQMFPLTDDYKSLAEQCAKIQATNDRQFASSPQTGLTKAHRHLLPPDEGGSGRERSDKMVYLLLAGRPDSYSCTEGEIFDAQLRTNDKNFFRDANRNAEDAALMEVSAMRLKKWQVISAGISKGVENEFLRRLQRVSAGSDVAGPIHAGTSPEQYSESLARILADNQARQLSLVQ